MDYEYKNASDYDDDFGDYSDEEDDTTNEPELPDAEDSEDSGKSHQPNQTYIVLKEDEIRQLQSNDVTQVSTVLSIPESDAYCLLPHFNWSASKLEDEWFADEDKVREKVGLLKEAVVEFNPGDSITCRICFDDHLYGSGSVFSAFCGHPFCGDCWNCYISTSINDGLGCLMLTCPEPKCKAAVGPDLISKLTSKEDNERYKHYLLRSYVEQSRTTKWCPAPNCEYAVKFNNGYDDYDVSCLCTNDFCWNCTEEIHRPVNCETVNMWIMKNKDDSQNAQWVLVNTKPCPKCKKPIEKNQGCNHVTCLPPCGYEFCWHCLDKFKNYDHICNGFRSVEAAEKADRSNESRDKKKIRKHLERYMHYYERWASNLSSKQIAIKDFKKVQNMHMDELALRQAESIEVGLKFITEAWQQIIKGRQILRWTYAYGYYIPEEESSKLQLFENLQGVAESSLERLHHCAETDLKKFIYQPEEQPEGPMEGFNDFRIKLRTLTKGTANCFEELVRLLENGLSGSRACEMCAPVPKDELSFLSSFNIHNLD